MLLPHMQCADRHVVRRKPPVLGHCYRDSYPGPTRSIVADRKLSLLDVEVFVVRVDRIVGSDILVWGCIVSVGSVVAD